MSICPVNNVPKYFYILNTAGINPTQEFCGNKGWSELTLECVKKTQSFASH